jgi:serine/threonine protein kinase
VTELLHGETLGQTLQSGAMPERRAIDIAVAIASALSAAHEKGIVHRDVKPENVFITADGHIEILQPSRGARRVVPGPALADGEDLVEWLADEQLYIARSRTVPMEVYRIDARTGVRRPWRTLMPADPTGLIGIRNVVIANNGESYAYSYRRVTSSDLYLAKSSTPAK